MKRNTKKIVMAWLPVLIWMAVIFWFSHQPGDVSGASSGRIVALISSGFGRVFPFISIEEEFLHFLFRKGAHFGVYAVLGILSVRAFQISGCSGRRGVLYGWILATIYAGTDEFHQTFIPGRSGEVSDVFIDSVGAMTGIGFYLLIKNIQFPSREGKHSLQYILLSGEEDGDEKDNDEKDNDEKGGKPEEILEEE